MECPLWTLFLAKDKADFVQRANHVLLSQYMIDLTARFAATERTQLRYKVLHKEKYPVQMTEKDWVSLQHASADQRTKSTRKLIATITQHNRSVFHAFWFEDTRAWWLLSFDLNDRKPYGNHWKQTGQPHAHMINYLTHPRHNLETFMDALANDPKYSLPHPVHIRFEDDGWQDIIWG